MLLFSNATCWSSVLSLALHGYLPHLLSHLNTFRIASSYEQRWSNSLALPNRPFLLNLNGQNIHLGKGIFKTIGIRDLKVQADDRIGCNDSV